MKLMIKNIWLLLLFLGVLMACNNEEGPESIVQTFEKFPVVEDDIAPLTVTEAGTYTVNIPFDERQIVAVEVSITSSESSTAVEGEDFTISAHDLSLLALSGGGSIDITILPDLEPEGNETIYLTLVGDHPIGSPAPQEILVINIRDSVYLSPQLVLDWSGPIEAFEGEVWQDYIDIDLLLLDGDGDEVSGYTGASADVPEVISTEDIPDGTYSVVANLWANPITGNGLETEDLPVVLTIALGGVGTASFSAKEIGLTPVWNGDTPSDEAGVNNLILGTITVNGNQMTLVDGNGDLVATFGTP
ncbi:MAG: hypothetical protein HC819_03145 [Cyclobacteriaceae bacterium]|nr:hypothetical protein [Cyclobacteriaceae bacterium]